MLGERLAIEASRACGPSSCARCTDEARSCPPVGPVGLEPTTYGLKVRSSTD